MSLNRTESQTPEPSALAVLCVLSSEQREEYQEALERFEASGLTLVHESDPDQALSRLEEVDPWLVIAGLEIGHMEGLEFIAFLMRKHPDFDRRILVLPRKDDPFPPVLQSRDATTGKSKTENVDLSEIWELLPKTPGEMRRLRDAEQNQDLLRRQERHQRDLDRQELQRQKLRQPQAQAQESQAQRDELRDALNLALTEQGEPVVPEPEAVAPPEPEAEVVPEPEAEAVPEPEAEVVPEPEAEPALAEPEAKAVPEPEAEPALAEPEAEPQPEAEPAAPEPRPAAAESEISNHRSNSETAPRSALAGAASLLTRKQLAILLGAALAAAAVSFGLLAKDDPAPSAERSAPHDQRVKEALAANPGAALDAALAGTMHAPTVDTSGEQAGTGAVKGDLNSYVALPLRFDAGDSAVRLRDQTGLVQMLVPYRLALEKNPDSRIEVGGHASEEGTPAFNSKLGKERARAAAKLLGQHDIPHEKMVIKSYGAQMAALGDDSDERRDNSRRVTIRLLKASSN